MEENQLWIIPKSTCTSVQDMMESEEDLSLQELASHMEPFMWRSKPTPVKTWLTRLKRESWVQQFATQTSKTFPIKTWLDTLDSSRQVSLVSHFPAQENEKELTTQDTSGPTSLEEFLSADPKSSSVKMSRESSALRPAKGSQFCNMSSKAWKEWVTEQRLEYSVRKKLGHLTDANECLSWLTPRANEPTENPETFVKRNGDRGAHCHGSPSGQVVNWQTPKVNQGGDCPSERRRNSPNLEAQANMNWPTARTSDAEGGPIKTEQTEEGFRSYRAKSDQWFGAKLRDAVETHEKNWPTPTVRDFKDTGNLESSRYRKDGKERMDTLGRVVQENHNTTGKPQEPSTESSMPLGLNSSRASQFGGQAQEAERTDSDCSETE